MQMTDVSPRSDLESEKRSDLKKPPCVIQRADNKKAAHPQRECATCVNQ